MDARTVASSSAVNFDSFVSYRPDQSSPFRRSCATTSQRGHLAVHEEGGINEVLSHEFPNFADGDVLIVSPNGSMWKLHSMYLANSSPFVRKILNTTKPVHLTRKQSEEGRTVRWRLEMTDIPEVLKDDDMGNTFKCFRSAPVSKGSFDLRYISPLLYRSGYNAVYDNLFRTFYNLEPLFGCDNDNDAKKFIADAVNLIIAADFLGALRAVKLVVEANLLRLNQVLWHCISDSPESWIMVGARIESPLIFREAMIHIVGRYKLPVSHNLHINKDRLEHEAVGALGAKVMALIEKKVKELRDLKMETERRLLEHFPARMIHQENDDTIPGRAVYGNDIYLWQALTIFRQYVGSAFASGMHHYARDGGLSFYRTIGEPALYLRPNILSNFHRLFEMSSKGRVCLAAAVRTVKEDMKPIVQDLLLDLSQITRRPDELPLSTFACTSIGDKELPWYASIADPSQSEDI